MSDQLLPRFVSLSQLEIGSNGGLNAPPLCNCGSCDACFTLGPFSTPVTPYGDERPFVPSLDGPPQEQNARPSVFPPVPRVQIPPPQGLAGQPSAIDLDQCPRSLENNAMIDRHVGMTYTPGLLDRGSLDPDYVFNQGLGQITDRVGNFAIQTPATTIPSLTAPWNHVDPIAVSDFVGKSRVDVRLECEPEAYIWAKRLADGINTQGFRLHGSGDNTDDGAIKAVQKSMSFNLQGRVPYTIDQLQTLRQTARLHGNLGSAPSNVTTQPWELSKVLEQYGTHTGIQFQLGVVSKTFENSYHIACYRSVDSSASAIWLFYDNTGEDLGIPGRWAAIVPSGYANSSRPSYAAAVASPAPAAQQNSQTRTRSKSSTLNSNYLSADFTPPRGRNGKSSRSGSRTQKMKPMHHHNKPRMTEGKHRCDECGRTFHYPKDKRRHATTHSDNKDFPCSYCTKSFTRKDNRQRHVRDDHPGVTPPPSTIASLDM